MSIITTHYARAGFCTSHTDCRNDLSVAVACHKASEAARMLEHVRSVADGKNNYAQPRDPSGPTVFARTYDSRPVEGECIAVIRTWHQPYVNGQQSTDPEDRTADFSMVYESHVGRVVAIETRCERVQSDIWGDVRYAWVALDAAGTDFRMVCLGEVWGGNAAHREGWPVSAVDADHLEPQLATWQAERNRLADVAAQLRRQEAEARRAAEEAATPRKGRTLRVVRGRKVAKGTQGVCIWVGESRWGTRVGIKVEGQADPVWVDARNVQVVAA